MISIGIVAAEEGAVFPLRLPDFRYVQAERGSIKAHLARNTSWFDKRL